MGSFTLFLFIKPGGLFPQQFPKKSHTMKVIPLSEGSFTVDKTKKFIPAQPQAENKEQKMQGSLLVEIQPFVVITKKDVILLDAGLGFNDENGMFQLYKNLKHAGIEPDEVTKVLMSHLHKDHIGGLINPYTHLFSFENALLYVQKKELDYGLQLGGASYQKTSLEIISSFPNLELLTEDEGEIDYYIHYEVTGAHAQFHQVFCIREEDEVVFFGGDDAPQLWQLKKRFRAKYDFDGEKAMQLREKWWKQGCDEQWSFLFYHDSKIPVYKKSSTKTRG